MLLSHQAACNSDTDSDCDSECSTDESLNGCLIRITTAKPQVCNGNGIWPEKWGITRQQIQELLETLRQDPLWSSDNDVYKLVSNFIIPWTRGRGVGYALLLNCEKPKMVNVMVSHAFAENAEQFLEAVVRGSAENDVYYICALSNYQAEDGSGPSIAEQLGNHPEDSPFRRVIHHVAVQGQQVGCRWRWYDVLKHIPVATVIAAGMWFCIPVIVRLYLLRLNVQAYMFYARTRLPVAFGLVMAAIFCRQWMRRWPETCSGRMLVVPNHQTDIYTRLWCVYEVFCAKLLGIGIQLAPTLAGAGEASSKHAKCSVDDDLHRIQGEIEQHFGFEKLDRSISRIARGNRVHILGTFLKYLFLQMIPTFAAYGIFVTWFDLLFWMLMAFTYALSLVAVYSLAWCFAGELRANLPLAMLALAVVSSCEASAYSVNSISNRYIPQAIMFFGREAQSIALIYLAALCKPFPSCFKAENRVVTLIALVALAFPARMIILRRRLLTDFGRAPLLPMVEDSIIGTWNFGMSLYMVWTESLHLGICVIISKRQRHATSAVAFIGLAIPIASTVYLVLRNV